MPKTAARVKISASDAEDAAQKRFYLMAGGGLLIVLALAYFALRPAADEAVAATPAAADSTAAAAPAPDAAPAAPAAPSVPGMSGGGGGRSAGGGGGRPGGGVAAAPTRPANAGAGAAAQPFTRERGIALGLSPRAASALADSASRSRSAPTSGRAAVTRPTAIMSGPASGTVLVTVSSGTPLTLSGCQDVGGSAWCGATHSGFSGWVRQADVGL